MDDYNKYRQKRIRELESLGYSYTPPDVLDEEGNVITPSGFTIDSDSASYYLRRLKIIGKRIQIEALRALELIILKECDDERRLDLFFC